MEIALWTVAILAIVFLTLRLGTAWLFRDEEAAEPPMSRARMAPLPRLLDSNRKKNGPSAGRR